MIYGLYLSAAGVMTNSYRQDVIANNLANAETTGFKRDVATFRQRLTEAQQRGVMNRSNALLENIGGGIFASPTKSDRSQVPLETTGNNLDAALLGPGYFAVQGTDGRTRLTRNGQFLVDRAGYLVSAAGDGARVLGPDRQPIQLDPVAAPRAEVSPDGSITVGAARVAQLGVFDVNDPSRLTKSGATQFDFPDDAQLLPSATSVQGRHIERANVDPATELTQLLDAQRQLEANANMIRYQDQSLGRLVNEVGKIS